MQQQEDLKKEVLSLKTNTQASIRALEANQQKLTDSQKFINEEFEKCKSKQENYEDRAKTAESKIVNLNAHFHSLQDTLRENCHQINDLEQYGRRCMVEISNIPVKPEESMKSIITALATNMNINNFSYNNDVDAAHGLHSKLSPPPIIVMFHSRTKRNEFYDKRKALRNITLKDLDLNFEENANIFVNESLTI